MRLINASFPINRSKHNHVVVPPVYLNSPSTSQATNQSLQKPQADAPEDNVKAISPLTRPRMTSIQQQGANSMATRFSHARGPAHHHHEQQGTQKPADACPNHRRSQMVAVGRHSAMLCAAHPSRNENRHLPSASAT